MPLLKANSVFVSNSFFIFITRFFPSLANLLVLVWYSRNLSENDYGNYQLFWIQLYVIYPLISFGLHNVITTYTRNFLANILSKIKVLHYVIYVFWAIALSVVFAVLQSRSGQVHFFTSLLFILSFSVGVITESLLIVFRKYNVLTWTGFLYAASFCGIHWWALSAGFSLQELFSLLLVVSMLRVFVYSCAVLIEVKKDVDGYIEEFVDLGSVRALWLHLGLYDVVQMLSTWVDKFAVALVLTAGLSAIYYNGAQNVPFLPILLSAAGSAVLLQLAGRNGMPEKEATLQLVNESGRMLSSVVFPVFFFLYIFRNELFVSVLSEKYIPAIPIFAVSILSLPVRAYSFTTVLQRAHKGHIINIGAVAELILAVALMYPLYLFMGLPGVALSFVISTYLQAAFYLIATARHLQVSSFRLLPLRNWVIKFILYGSVLFAIHYLGTMQYSGKATLLLGALGMTLLVLFTFVFELNRKKHYGRAAEPIQA